MKTIDYLIARRERVTFYLTLSVNEASLGLFTIFSEGFSVRFQLNLEKLFFKQLSPLILNHQPLMTLDHDSFVFPPIAYKEQ